MKGWVAVRSPSGPTFDLKFFTCDYSCGLQKYFVKTLNCCINMLLLCIADIIGIYKDFLNKKGKRNKKHCIMSGKVFKSTDLQSHKRNHTKL